MTRRKQDQQEREVFAGFERPEANFFRMPNSWTDVTATIDSIAELKVVEYILRHTWGYQEFGIKKHITIDEFVQGRRRQDGSRMDKGTGLSERAVYDGLRKAVANGLIEEETDDADRGRVKKSYSLRMRDTTLPDPALQSLQSGVQSLQGGVQSLHPGPQTLQGRDAAFAPRTEKDTLERQKNLSKFEGSHDIVEETADAREVHRQAPSAFAMHSVAPTEPPRQIVQTGAAAGPASLKDLIARRRQNSAGPRRGRPPGKSVETSEARERLRAFLTDFAVELGDEAPLASTITRTLNIFTAANVPPARWGDYLYQARGLTQEHTAQIRKTAGEGGGGMRRKNKMPYFLATLEQLTGLRPGPSEQSSLQKHPDDSRSARG